MKIKKQLLLFLLFFYFFLFRDFLERTISIFQYVDELTALTAIPIFFLRLKQTKFKLKLSKVRAGCARYITLLAAIGLLSTFWFCYQPMIAVLSDLCLVVKFWLAIYVGKSFLRGFVCQKNAHSIFVHIKLMTWFYAALIISDHVSGGLFRANIRYGLRSTHLFYSHPTVFAGCCVLLAVILLSIRSWIKGSEKYLVILLFMTCTTLRSKAVAVAVVIALIYYFSYIRKKQISLKTVVIFVPLVALIGWAQIEYYFFSSIQSGSARYQLLVNSIEIANDHFPFGAGFATFGSYYSGVYYSPLYAMYGISNIRGLSPSNTAYISDSFWPMILAQFGWFGLITYCIAVFMLFRRIQDMRSDSKAFYASGLSILMYLLITSMAEAAFVHPQAIPFAIWLGVLFQTTEFGNYGRKS